MGKNTGLGKGLGALFSVDSLEEIEEKNVVPQTPQFDNSEIIHKIKISEIEPNKNQPRRTFNSESIE